MYPKLWNIEGNSTHLYCSVFEACDLGGIREIGMGRLRGVINMFLLP